MSQDEKFYVRDNLTQRWIINSVGEPVQFSSQRIAKQYTDKCLCKFTVFSYNHATKKLKWRGGIRVI